MTSAQGFGGMTVAVIGAGAVGAGLARRLSAVGHDVRVSTSRGADSPSEIAARTGAAAQGIGPAVDDARVVVLAVPYLAVGAVAAAGAWAHKVVIDVTNFYEPRDGGDLKPGPEGSSVEVQRRLAGALGVKAFNNLPARMLLQTARQGDERVAIPIAADDDGAARVVETLITDMGFAPVRAGTLIDAAKPLDVGGPVFGSVLNALELRAALGLI